MGQALKIYHTIGRRSSILLNSHDVQASLSALITQAVRDGDDRLALALDEVLQQVEAIAEDAARLPCSCPAAAGDGITLSLRQ